MWKSKKYVTMKKCEKKIIVRVSWAPDTVVYVLWQVIREEIVYKMLLLHCKHFPQEQGADF